MAGEPLLGNSETRPHSNLSMHIDIGDNNSIVCVGMGTRPLPLSVPLVKDDCVLSERIPSHFRYKRSGS